MITAIIIDDELLARALVKEYLLDHPGIEVVAECSDGFEGIKSIQALQPDLVFLDIQMPKLNGFEMLELLDHQPMIIFTTAFDEYALKAFEADATDYLLKPFSKERFDRALKKCIEHQNAGETKPVNEALENYPESSDRIVLKVNNSIKILSVQEVMYIEAYDDYVKIYAGESCFVKKKTMAFYEKQLEKKGFVRIHRSYLMNVAFLTRIEQTDKDSYMSVLKNGKRLTLSRNGYNILKEKLDI